MLSLRFATSTTPPKDSLRDGPLPCPLDCSELSLPTAARATPPRFGLTVHVPPAGRRASPQGKRKGGGTGTPLWLRLCDVTVKSLDKYAQLTGRPTHEQGQNVAAEEAEAAAAEPPAKPSGGLLWW